jgi:hypothetical protein
MQCPTPKPPTAEGRLKARLLSFDNLNLPIQPYNNSLDIRLRLFPKKIYFVSRYLLKLLLLIIWFCRNARHKQFMDKLLCD